MTQSARRVRSPRIPSAFQRFHEPDAPMDAIADHCLALRALVSEHGSSVMLRLVDLLLLEVGETSVQRCQAATVLHEQLEDA